jgi:hypothetical protein
LILAIFFKELTEAKEMCDYFVQYIAGAHLVISEWATLEEVYGAWSVSHRLCPISLGLSICSYYF